MTTVIDTTVITGANRSHPPVTDRRKELRYPCHDPAEVRVVRDGEASFPATIRDISKSGLRVASAVQLTQGSRVEIVLVDQAVVFGEVRYCRAVGQEFHAGVLIQQAFYSMDLSREHLDHKQMSKYLAGEGMISREVLALSQHIRFCADCRTRLDAMSLSERVGRGRMTKR